MFGLKARRRKRIIREADLGDCAWQNVLDSLPVTHNLSRAEKQRLRDLVILFLHEKDFSGAGGLELTQHMRLVIAAQACLIILNLGIDYFAGWGSIIVYPSVFRPERSYTDDAGVVHQNSRVLSGEAWDKGPVILSWDNAQPPLYSSINGSNVVIHEFSHKLDMLNGNANGMPPLHENMNMTNWASDFSVAYETLCSGLRNGIGSPVNPYAAENPAEFFAVLSEAFFTIPERVSQAFPAVYLQLKAFYRQDPARRARQLFVPVSVNRSAQNHAAFT